MGTHTLAATAWCLGFLAILLAWPIPLVLTSSRWCTRTPALSLMLWQAVGLAGGLSMISAFFIWAVSPLGSDLGTAVTRLLNIISAPEVTVPEYTPDEQFTFWHIVAFTLALLLLTHLVGTLIVTYSRMLHQRRRHRLILELLSNPSLETPSLRVLPQTLPLAYCLPGGSRSVTVLSEGLLELLSAEELQAVLAHEHAHLNQRHHLLLWVFAAWKAALPWLPTTRLAQEAVTELIEMLADDTAASRTDARTLARAIARMGTCLPTDDASPTHAPLPSSEGEYRPPVLIHRIDRLLHRPARLNWGESAAVVLTSSALLIGPAALLCLPIFW